MIKPPKNHTISQMVAKLTTRLFVLLLLLSVVPFLAEESYVRNLNDTYLYVINKWVLLFPLLLFFGFLTLLVLVLKFRYGKTDLNWMLSLNATLLVLYLVLLYIRIFPLIFIT